MTYSLRLSADEVARYRMMAQRAQAQETDLWKLAGLTPGARVADVGCGPGAMVAALAEIVGPGGHVVGVDGDEQAVETARALLAAAAVTNAEVQAGQAQDTGLLGGRVRRDRLLDSAPPVHAGRLCCGLPAPAGAGTRVLITPLSAWGRPPMEPECT